VPRGDSDASHPATTSGDGIDATGIGDREQNTAAMTFARAAWIVTVLICIVSAVALLASGYQGYAAVLVAVGAAAAINLT
jgi:hypothetical protein